MANPPDDVPAWRMHGERTLYDNRWVKLTQVDVEPPDGSRFWHHVVYLDHVSIAVVLDDTQRVLMLWRHRFVPNQFGWELPGGICEAGESPAVTAARETEEETGFRPGEPKHLITFEPQPGMVASPHHLYLFQGATEVGGPTDEEEASHIEWIPLDEVMGLIAQGKVAGCGSLVGLLWVLANHKVLSCP